ncbi:L2HGDH [Cordylochernes scorpioides]|uniref:L-2-hydroxyglutarate dehydrogenase, mitochondrial n=1 Tax=Cordylochernes scorpioides TaxID=51811 RepID=A0ABY6L319_9ARAC|nr:L2HGDH [Cordylochernes scorpioides]
MFLDTLEPEYDVAVVGGGIVGLATAQELITRCPQLRIVLLEKEAKLVADMSRIDKGITLQHQSDIFLCGMHQSGHNSGVIHAGIYYQPGSMKAKLCVEGMNLLYQYCDTHKIPYKKCGKDVLEAGDLSKSLYSYAQVRSASVSMELPLVNVSTCELRSVIRFFTAKNETAVNIHRNLVSVYGEGCMSIQMVRRWRSWFLEGRQNVHDDERSDRPVTATDNAAVAAVRNVVEANRRVTIDEIMIRLPPGIEIGCASIGTIMSDLIVAVTPEETQQIRTLLERGQKNGVRDLKVLSSKEILEYAPYCKGLQAIWSPHTGIIDYGRVCQQYGRHFQHQGGDIRLNFPVAAFTPVAESQDSTGPLHSIRISDSTGLKAVRARSVITAGGLFSDKLAQMSGGSSDPKIIPFRGEYLVLRPNLTHLATTNIYPVPDPRFPFLGVHFTPRMDGSVWLGPNAVLAFKREGYTFKDISLSDLMEFSSYPGLRKLAQKYMYYGLQEMYRGLVPEAQVRQLQRYVPSLSLFDVTEGPAGVRAQALGRDGTLVDDFVFDCGLEGRVLHVRNAPSPAATSSLAIAKSVVDRAVDTFKL